jgi:hypothetical protein
VVISENKEGCYGLFTVKVKVESSLCCNWASRHEGVLGEWRYSATHSLTSEVDGGEWSASRSGRFTPRERAPRSCWIRGWVGPRAVLDAVVKGKIPSPCRESNPRTATAQSAAQRYTDWAIAAFVYLKCYPILVPNDWGKQIVWPSFKLGYLSNTY